MLKLIYFILVTFILSISCTDTSAQVNKIKKGSDKNKSSGGNKSSKTGGNGGSSDDCTSACIDLGSAVCFSAFTDLLLDLHSDYLDDADKIHPTVSLDLMPHVGYEITNMAVAHPRVRGNWGIFSTDARFTTLIENVDDGYDFYNTIDWQVIELNPIITEPLILRFGTGLMYETYGKSFFNEHFMGVDVFLQDYQYMINTEGRIALDYETGATPRTEANMRFNYRFFKGKNLFGYATLGGLYQNSYSKVDLWAVMAGCTFNIH